MPLIGSKTLLALPEQRVEILLGSGQRLLETLNVIFVFGVEEGYWLLRNKISFD